MPSLVPLMDADHFERVADVMALRNPYKLGALLGSTSRQLSDVNEFPIGAKNADGTLKYTPGGVALTGANLMAAVANAYDDALAAGGGTVLIPSGHWSLNLSDAFHRSVNAGSQNIQICGSGMDDTFLELPQGYANTLFKFSGEAFPGDFYKNGGLSNLSINCVNQHASNTGTALHTEACINFQACNLTIRNFAGGTGWKARKVGVDGTNQYPQLWNVSITGCYVNFDWQSMVNGQACGLYSNAGVHRDFICDDVKFSAYGGNIQSSAPILVELAGEGNCRLVFHDFYYEGFSNLLFKLNVPSGSFNVLELHGFHMGGNPALFVDTDVFNSVVLTSIYGAGNATVILKARNGSDCTLINSGSIVDAPTKFDLDPASLLRLTCLGSGVTQYFGGRVVPGIGLDLPGYPLGAEPSSPTAGRLLRDTTNDRPTFRRAAGDWKRFTYTSDEFHDISALLAPYCTEIFDPRIKRLRSVVAGGLDTLTGLLGGTVLSAPAAGQRPVWNIADDYFGGRPSFECAFSTDKFVSGTLTNTIQIGSRYGVLVLFRALVAGTDSNRRIPVYLTSASRAVGCLVGYGDLNDATHAYAHYFPAVGLDSNLVGPASIDLFGHAAFVTSDPLNSLYYDDNAVVAGVDHGLSTEVINKLHIGAAWDSLQYKGCDVAVAYVAILKSSLPPDVRDLVTKLAMTKYALR